MRILITADPDNYPGASRQTLRDLASIAERFDFQKVDLGNYRNALSYLRLLLGRKRYDCVLVAYPYFCRPVNNRLRNIELKLLRKVARGGKVIAYVVDLPIEQYEAAGKGYMVDEKGQDVEGRFFRMCDKVLVFNEAMEQVLTTKYSIPQDRFVRFEMLDYTVRQPEFTEMKLEGQCHIGYAGSLDRAHVEELAKAFSRKDGICLDLYGKADDWISSSTGASVHHHGEFDPADIVNELAIRCHFGLIIRGEGDPSWDRYHEYTSTSKFSSYMVSGVPILVPSKYGYISGLVKKYDVGLAFTSLGEIPWLIKTMDEGRYLTMRRNAYELGKRISAGSFLTQGLAAALGEHPSEGVTGR